MCGASVEAADDGGVGFGSGERTGGDVAAGGIVEGGADCYLVQRVSSDQLAEGDGCTEQGVVALAGLSVADVSGFSDQGRPDVRG